VISYPTVYRRLILIVSLRLSTARHPIVCTFYGDL
jgi:hypothetical protein